MHQHLRSPAPLAPNFRARSDLARDESQCDRNSYVPPVNTDETSSHTDTKGLGIDTAAEVSEKLMQKNVAPSREAMAKLNQIISNYHTKAALIILHSRIELPPSFAKGSDTPRVNRWFNVELDDTDVLREQLKIWRVCDATENRPPPMIIETFLDGSGLTNNQALVIIDENGKRWDVLESVAAFRANEPVRSTMHRPEIILERWKIELGEPMNKLPADLGPILPTVYKKGIVLFRSLFTYSKFLPAWKFAKRYGKLRPNPALRIKYRILDGEYYQSPALDSLAIPLFEGDRKVVDKYNFGVTESPAGPFSIEVTYRTNCDFRVDDSEALLSSRFMGADDAVFRPSLPLGEQAKVFGPEIGSLPVEKREVEQPDLSRAYGSLSTFHQVVPATSASPISMLRAVRDSGASSPSPPVSSSPKFLPATKLGPVGRVAASAGQSGSPIPRRPSISFQAFKAPPLSASPALVETPLGASPRTTSSRGLVGSSSAPKTTQPSMAAYLRKSPSVFPEQAMPSPNSASPKAAPISKYSSSFSHRRSRPPSGGTNKAEDDTSSGKASTVSSTAQPGSGLLADPTGTSADSYHTDDDNISEFLKMLDLRKDLLNPTSPAALDATTRRTTAALNRFQRMRESNAALSDSMSNSLLLHRSSNSSSKQLSGVPPMVGGTSASTASSPGKPISPHTPHTPAIPSRLSFNSIVDYTERDTTRQGLSHDERDSLLVENPSDDPPIDRNPSTVNAIDIPTSPRRFASPYRRSSSVAHPRCTATNDEDDIFPFGMRSVSLGAEERPGVSLAALRQQELEQVGASQTQRAARTSSLADDPALAIDSAAGPEQETASTRASTTRVPTGIPLSNTRLYQPRFALSRDRGSSGPAHSLSSASSRSPHSATTLPQPSDRDIERDGSGSTSVASISETRRGSGQRPGSGRGQPQTMPFEDDEPLLFAMSDFGVSRRSLEEARHYGHSTDSASNTGGSRRGSGRRGNGAPNFHPW